METLQIQSDERIMDDTAKINPLNKTVEIKHFLSVDNLRKLLNYALATGEGNYVSVVLTSVDVHRIAEVIDGP